MNELSVKDVQVGEIDAVRSEVISTGTGYNTKEWHNLRQRARRNNYSLPKQVLVDAIKKKIREKGILHKVYDNVLVVELTECRGKAEYKTWDDIPNESVPCPCGDIKHWLIKYVQAMK